MTDSRSIYITTDDPIPFLFRGWVIFHCIYVPLLLYPFLCPWTFSFLPCPGYLHPIWASHTIYPRPGSGIGNSSLQDKGHYASLLLSTPKLVEMPSLHICMLVLFPLSLSPSLSLFCLSRSFSWPPTVRFLSLPSWSIPIAPHLASPSSTFPTSLSLSCVQIDQPELDVLLKQKQEPNYAQVRWCRRPRSWPLTLEKGRGQWWLWLRLPFPQILREYLNYLNRLVTLLGGDPTKVGNDASYSLFINSQLNLFLRPGEQQQAQGKVFEMVTIDQLQVPRAKGWGRWAWRSCSQTFLIFMSSFSSLP